MPSAALRRADRVTDLGALADDIVRTQTGCAIALELRIAPDEDREAVGAALAELVDAAQGRVATGFLGTPLVLPALASVGRFDSAYKMLLRSEAPSWLYQVAQGATTVWERWDAIRPDGSIHPGTMAPMNGDGEDGHMLSFNHYAYGAVIDWVYRHVAGLAPDRARPGLRSRQLRTTSRPWHRPRICIRRLGIRDRLDRLATGRGPTHCRYRAADRDDRLLHGPGDFILEPCGGWRVG